MQIGIKIKAGVEGPPLLLLDQIQEWVQNQYVTLTDLIVAQMVERSLCMR